MKQQVQQPAPVSRTLQGKVKASNQASVSNVLQAYKDGIFQRQVVDELLQGKFETTQRDELDDDELLQGKFETAQRVELEDNELLQGKFETVQHDELEDDELLQGKFETTQRDELLQGKFETAQRDELEDDELLQGKFETAQRDELEDDELLQGKFETAQRQEAPNNTGLPDSLKTGVEQLSGLDMSDVKVHYNSSKPASVQAYAYTQGTDIHVAPGQEKHLGHEAWHVAQQKQGRVQPTTTVEGMPVNDNAGLEKEADVMGEKAVQLKQEVNRSKAVTNFVAQKKNNVKDGFGFVDNRPKSNNLKSPLQRTKWLWDTNLNPAAWVAIDQVFNQGQPQRIGKHYGDYYDDGVTANIIPTPTCTYDPHGDKHFTGEGSQWLEKKVSVNGFIVQAIIDSKGPIFNNRKADEITNYYLQVTCTKDIGIVKISKTKLENCPKTKTYLVQIAYNRLNNTVEYHGYPIIALNTDGLGYTAKNTGSLI